MTDPIRSLRELQKTPITLLEQQIRRGERTDELEAVFGPKLAAEMQQMVQQQPAAVLGGTAPRVVLLPGIMGSTLRETGRIGMIWMNILALLRGRMHLLALNADGTPITANTRIAPVDLMATTYLPMRLHLKYLGGLEVLPFPFDWRFAPASAVESLRAFLARQMAESQRPLHLVGHSMGGLVARAYCLRYPDEARKTVAQVIAMGSPFYGSFEAVRNLTVGGDTLKMLSNVTNDPTLGQIIRSMPGVYSLLPAAREDYPAGVRPYPFETDFDWYDPDAYQTDVLAGHLAATRAAYHSLVGKQMPVPTSVIAGHGVPTTVGLVRRNDATFDFDTRRGDGDGTVPLASATAIPGVHQYFLQDAKHGDLPLYTEIRSAVQALVHGDTPALPQAFGAGVLGPGKKADDAGLPVAPPPGTESTPEIKARARRVRTRRATPQDLALLSRLA